MSKHRIKIAALIVLIAAIVTAIWLLRFTELGQTITGDADRARLEFRAWSDAHPLAAPIAFVGTYVTLAVLMLPVWWLQILAGAAFGLWVGTIWSQVGATISAIVVVSISRWLAADWFHARVESRLQKLREVDEKLGHNGLLVVMAVRLAHVMPFGISNYVFGVTTISLRDVAIGTSLGNIPVAAMWIAGGAGYHPLTNGKFITAIAALHVVLLIPIALRYWKPDWFRKLGIE